MRSGSQDPKDTRLERQAGSGRWGVGKEHAQAALHSSAFTSDLTLSALSSHHLQHYSEFSLH